MKQRIYSLDFLKVMATFCIICHHYQIYTGVYFERGLNFSAGIIEFGRLVELFFILSGFFIYRYQKKIEEGMSFDAFFIPKYVRFLCPRALTVFLFAALCLWYENIYGVLFFDRTPTIFNVIQAALGFSTGWGLPLSKMNGTIWYISVLLICYIVFFLCSWIAGYFKVNSSWLFCVCIFVSFAITTYQVDFLFLNEACARGYSSFFGGILLARLLDGRKIGMRMGGCAMVFFLIAFFTVTYWKNSYAADHLEYLYTFLLFPLLIVFMLSPVMTMLFHHHFWGWLSMVSFEAYIWHFPLLLLLLDLNGYFNWNLNFVSRKIQLLLALCSFAVGIVCFYSIEKPSVKWLTNRIGALIEE